MKRFGFLYEKVYDMENIRLAHKNARKGKLYYREVQMVDANPEKYFEKIYKMLKNKAFRNSKYYIFKKIDKGKEREIYRLPYFPDRIIHHCIMQVVEPIRIKTLIADTYACIKKRGIHKAIRKIQRIVKNDKIGTQYCLKLDISKFYPSVDHNILKEIIRHKIKDEDLLWLLDEIIDSAKGIPIGNYLSQHFGNLYLSSLDHFMKEKCKYYFRYSDDIIIFNESKSWLHIIFSSLKSEVVKALLKIKPNYQIFPTFIRGLDFLGYRIFEHYTLLRKRIAMAIKQYNKKSFTSYCGWMKFGNCFHLQKEYFRRLENVLYI